MAKGRSRLLGAWSLLGRGMPVWLATDDAGWRMRR